MALQRKKPEEYGNDPINWTAAEPSPGRHQAFAIQSLNLLGGSLLFNFPGVAQSTYTVQSQNSIPGSSWLKLTNFSAQSTSSVKQVTAPLNGSSSRYYRVVTPALP
jgi:hypothetical protein